MEFETHVLEYKGSTEWVEDKIFEIKKVLIHNQFHKLQTTVTHVLM